MNKDQFPQIDRLLSGGTNPEIPDLVDEILCLREQLEMAQWISCKYRNALKVVRKQCIAGKNLQNDHGSDWWVSHVEIALMTSGFDTREYRKHIATILESVAYFGSEGILEISNQYKEGKIGWMQQQ